MDVEKMLARLREKASELGLPFGERKKTYNSRLAQELGLWAESKGKGELFHKAAFHAYFADGKNIAEIPVLVELAASVGLTAEEAAEVLSKRVLKLAVDEDWKLARMMGITAVPTLSWIGIDLWAPSPIRCSRVLSRPMGEGAPYRGFHLSDLSDDLPAPVTPCKG